MDLTSMDDCRVGVRDSIAAIENSLDKAGASGREFGELRISNNELPGLK